jgi:hypothetical protein
MRVDIEELKKKGEQAIKDIAGLKVRNLIISSEDC